MPRKEKLPTSKWERTKEAGKASLKIGLKHVKHKASSPFLNESGKKGAKKIYDEEVAGILFKALSTLKGTALKAAQILCLELDFLPPAFKQELSKAYYKVPPMNKALIRKVLISEFGSPPERVFKTFNNEAFAAASIGQVHEAVLKNRLSSAVKVQYPGIRETIKNDVQILRTLLLKLIPKNKIKYNHTFVKDIIIEIEARLLEETDYVKEMKTGKWFLKNVKLKGVVIPEVYEEFSTGRVLAMQRLQGLHLDTWLEKNPSQEERNVIGQRIYDFFMHCMFDLKLLHADPNPGNFLFMDGGTLGVLDFGCVRKLSDTFTVKIKDITRNYIKGDYDTVWKAYQSLGMIEKNLFEPEKLKALGNWLTEQLMVDVFDFKSNPGYVDRGIEISGEMDFFKSAFAEYVFFDRYFFGINRILDRLGAEVEIKKHWV